MRCCCLCQRASGAAKWAVEAGNAEFVEEAVQEKASQEAVLLATVWRDSRKWAMGSKAAKDRAAAARQILRVLQRFEKQQPDRQTALTMLRELRADTRRWERELFLESDLSAEYAHWVERWNGMDGALLILSKEFMDKAEAERQTRLQLELRLRAEAEAKAQESVEKRQADRAAAGALSASEEKLRQLAEEAHAQPRRPITEGCRCVLREGYFRKGSCLEKGDVGRVVIHEQLSNRAKVASEKTSRISWYSCETEVRCRNRCLVTRAPGS